MARNGLTHANFFKLCQWVSALPKPVKGTYKKLSRSARAELKLPVSVHAITSACEATGVTFERAERRQSVKAPSSRLVLMAKCLRAVIQDVEEAFGGKVIKPETRELLRLLCWDKGVDDDMVQAAAKVPDPLDNGRA